MRLALLLLLALGACRTAGNPAALGAGVAPGYAQGSYGYIPPYAPPLYYQPPTTTRCTTFRNTTTCQSY